MLKHNYAKIFVRLVCIFCIESIAAAEQGQRSDSCPRMTESSPRKIVKIELETDTMSNVISLFAQNGIKLEETAFFFDWDETLCRKVLTLDEEEEFEFISNSDLRRTYQWYFMEALNQAHSEDHEDFLKNNTPGVCPLYLEKAKISFFEDMNGYLTQIHKEADIDYKILDPGAKTFIETLKQREAMVAVCSALAPDNDKQHVMEELGIQDYVYKGSDGCKAEDKAEAMRCYLNASNHKAISTIVLMDNSKEYALDPYFKKMTRDGFISSIKGTTQSVNVVGIHFTKVMEDYVRVDAIAKELTDLYNIYEQAKYPDSEEEPSNQESEEEPSIDDVHQTHWEGNPSAYSQPPLKRRRL